MMCSEPCACWVVAELICFVISCRRSTECVTVSLPFACSRVALAISLPIPEALLDDSRMRFSALPASCDSETPSSTSFEPFAIVFSALATSSCTLRIRLAISRVDEAVRSDSSRISAATTEKPLPYSPACAARTPCPLPPRVCGKIPRIGRERVRLLGDFLKEVEDLAEGGGALAEARDD